MGAALLYGRPAAGLIEAPGDAVQVSPLIPGSQDLGLMAAGSADLNWAAGARSGSISAFLGKPR